MDNDDKTGFKYRSNDTFSDDGSDGLLVAAGSQPVMAQEIATVDDDQIEWTALEFEERPKSFVWYFYLAIVVAVVAILVYLASKDYFGTGLVVVIGLLFAFSASRKPRKLNYRLSANGINIAGRARHFSSFKAFWLSMDAAEPSFSLLPLKRFVPTLKIFFDGADLDKISKILSDNLPLTEPRLDPIDRFLQKIHF